jgi:hypothetical protein
VSRRFRLPKDRLVALAADWGLLLLLSYCVYFLINYWYRATMVVKPSYQVPFPTYAYALTIVSTFLLAILWENLGTSIGWKGVGLVHSDGHGRPPALRRRPRRLGVHVWWGCDRGRPARRARRLHLRLGERPRPHHLPGDGLLADRRRVGDVRPVHRAPGRSGGRRCSLLVGRAARLELALARP